MSFLTSNELAQLRDDIEALMPDTCHIMRRTQTNDKGHTSDSLGTAAASVACRVDPLKRAQDAGLVADQEKGVTYWQVTVPYDTDVRDGDEIVYSSDTYRFIQLHDDHSARACRRIVVARKGS